MKAKIFNYSFWIKETDASFLFQELRTILLMSGFKILDSVSHNFDPCGYTALFLLAESHLALHTFPEENKTYVELSSCNEDYFYKFRNLISLSSKIKLTCGR